MWIRKKNLRGNCLDDLRLEELTEMIYENRNCIKYNFDETKGTARGDDFLKGIAREILP
jgi:hypothetical protein